MTESQADYYLNYGFSGDTALWTVYEGQEIVFETDDYNEYKDFLKREYEYEL